MNHPANRADELGELLRRSLQDESPPAQASRRALALHGAAGRLARQATTLWRRLVAEPVSGGTVGFAPALGVRGVAGPAHRLLRAEECEIDLRISPRGETWSLAGQIFGVPQAQHVELSGPGSEALARLGETSEFSFDDLPAGRYSMTVKAPQLDIVVPPFDIGAAGATDRD